MRGEGEPGVGQTEKQDPLKRVFLPARITGLHSDEILEMYLPVRQMPLGMRGPEGADLLVKYGGVFYPAKEDSLNDARITITSKDIWSADGEKWNTSERREEWIKERNERIAKNEREDNKNS